MLVLTPVIVTTLGELSHTRQTIVTMTRHMERLLPMLLTLLTALGEPEKNREALEVLSAKAEKVKKHQAEAKAHVKNVRKGKKKQ